MARANALTTGEDWSKIEPMLAKYCYDCHGGKKTKGGIDLKKLHDDPSVGKEFALWNKVKDALKNGDMPPEEDPQLSKTEQEQVHKWLGHSLQAAIDANAGDPGTVTIRRLTNAEYDRTIRDLTGIDYKLSKDFQPDGGGGEGFSNIGDVLFVNPQQLDKYFGAARKLAEHATIMPGSGIGFQEQRVGLRGPVQVRAQAEQGLYVWYQKMAAPYLPKDGEDAKEAAYMTACWKFKYKDQTGAVSLEQLAKESGLMVPFLDNWWTMLNDETRKSRYLDLTRVAWRELPGPDAAKPKEVPPAVQAKITAIQDAQRSWLGSAKNPGGGVQRMQQDADGIRPYPVAINCWDKKQFHLVVSDVGDGNKGDYVTFSLTLEQGKGSKNKKKELYVDWLRRTLDLDKKALAEQATKPVPDVEALKARIALFEAAAAKFGVDPRGGKPQKPSDLVLHAPVVVTFPLPDDATAIKGEGKLDIDGPEGEFASVQWMGTADAPPDPTKIIPGRLTVWRRQTQAASDLMREFTVMRMAFPDEYLRRMEEVARNYQRGGKGPGVYYFSDAQLTSIIPAEEKQRWEKMMGDWNLVKNKEPNPKQGAQWDAALQKAVVDFATKAWRRPLAPEELTELSKLYADGRAKELDRESAAREVVLRVLVSPNFLFKLEDASQPGEHPLNAWELATRLSYFLWSSTPDDRLRQLAADGSLLKPEVFTAEVQRMLKHRRANALADEFAGQWLKFNGFVEKANVDPTKFPEFTPELRRDMAREASEFFTYFFREDRPVREIVGADYTFLNERLAKFYGVPNVTGDEFRKVPVAEYHRGGVLGMGTVLTKNSYPHRTSPVLRGNWLLTSVLGTPTPPPPNDVPKLDDSAAKATTLRSRLEAHRADKACSVCHDKIDPLGFALEGFDVIGRVRTKDEAGQPVDDSGQMKNGPKFQGLDGLRQFLSSRDKEFTEHFCRMMVGYALGRTVLPTDQPLINTMQAALAKSDGHVSAAILTLAQSRQFQHRRND